MRTTSRGAVLASYVGAASGLAILAYFRFANHHALAAVIYGALGGAIVPIIALRWDDARKTTSPTFQRPHVFDLLAGGLGVAVMIYGIARTDTGIALSGVPLIVIGAGVYAVRWFVYRRKAG